YWKYSFTAFMRSSREYTDILLFGPGFCPHTLLSNFTSAMTVDLEGGKDLGLLTGRLRALVHLGPDSHKLAQVHGLQHIPHRGPGALRADLHKPNQQQGEPAQQDVRTDPIVDAVIHRPQVQRALQGAEG